MIRPAVDWWAPVGAESDPDRTMTGDRQRRRLLNGSGESRARWGLLGQQVMFARDDTLDGPGVATNMDTWDGYPAARERITRVWLQAGLRNPVVLTRDIHAHYACDLNSIMPTPTRRRSEANGDHFGHVGR